MEKKSDCHEALDKFVKDYGPLDSMIYDGKNRLDQAQNSKPNLENTASMGIHQKWKFPTKTQQKALFGNCAKNGIEKCVEHTVQENYGATDTHTLPRLCN